MTFDACISVYLSNPPTDFLCGHSVNKTVLSDESLSTAFLALLNSRFMDWCFRITSTNNHVQGYQLEQLPIPSMTRADVDRLDILAREISVAKECSRSSDTRSLEAEVDGAVYRLFKLNDQEIQVIEKLY